MEGIPVPVTLIVKASNQQFEDQTIKCELSWTISKLKHYLSEVYPSKPSQDEQKLIYSGQLLHDTVILKDILRQYDGQETHTVHIVFTPKGNHYSNSKNVNSGSSMKSNRSTNTRSTTNNSPETSEGLRQRNTQSSNNNANNNNNANRSQNIPITPNTNYLNSNFAYSGTQATTTQPNNEYLLAQQMAMQNWMQQAYMQYMNQYMTFLSGGVRPENIYIPQQQQQNEQHGVTQLSNLQNMAYMQQYLTPASSQPQVQLQTNVNLSANTQAQPQQQPAPEAQVQDGGDAAVVPQQNDRAERRFPNLINDEQENRDWLDIFYAFTRLCILLTVIYFYSSPVRCLIVICIGIAIYLYQLGLFRNILQRPNINNAVNNNNNMLEPEHNNNNDNVVNENEENNANLNEQQPLLNQNTVNNNNNTEAPRNENEGAVSMIEGIRTLFFSFFASIIPEAPAL